MVEELDVEILEQESFADVAAQFLDENGYLRLLAPRCSGTAGGNDTVSYTVVSNTVQIHQWLSGYGHSAFVFDHNSSGRSKGTLEVLAGGVGTTATDVLLQLKGPPMEIWSVSVHHAERYSPVLRARTDTNLGASSLPSEDVVM